MNRLLLFIMMFVLLILTSCGDPKKEAEEALKNNDYETAYKKFVEVANEADDKSQKKIYREKAILTDIHRQVYRLDSRLSKTLRPLQTRIDKALDIEEPSEEFLSGYAEACAKVADVFIAFEANDRIKKENYKKALEILSTAIEMYPNSQVANEAYDTIVEEEYNEAIVKGDEYYEKYQSNKRKNEDQLVYAESWYSKAQRMRKTNDDLNKKLNDIRKRSMSIAEVDETVFFVVNAFQKKDGNLLFKIALKNNTEIEQDLNSDNFSIKLQDGSEVKPDLSLTGKLVSKSSVFKNGTIKRYKIYEGTFAIAATENLPISITYNDGTNTAQYKNLPLL